MDINSQLNFAAGGRIVNLPTPINDQDAATKAYVDTGYNTQRWRNHAVFWNGVLGTLYTTSMSGGFVSPIPAGDVPFGIRLSRQFVATNRAGVMNTLTVLRFGHIARAYMEALIIVENALPDATNDYEVTAGWHDSTSAAPVDGAFFGLLRGTHATQWVCATSNNGVQTLVPSGLVCVPGTWYWLQVEVLNTGGGVYNARFYNKGTLLQTITTNIPLAEGRECGQCVNLRGISGTDNRSVSLRWIYTDIQLASPIT